MSQRASQQQQSNQAFANAQSLSANNQSSKQSEAQASTKQYQSKSATIKNPIIGKKLTAAQMNIKQPGVKSATGNTLSQGVNQGAPQFQAKTKSTISTAKSSTASSSQQQQAINGLLQQASTLGNLGGERLEVTVIPVDEEPYSKIVSIPHSLIGSSQHSTSVPTTGSPGFPVPANASASSASAALNTSNQYPSLKDIFQTSDSLWKNIFGSFVQANKQPLFSVFRKKIERKASSIIQSIPANSTSELGLHILFLKCDGTKFPRNAYANSLEVYCSTYFYGPLVIVFGDTNPPYRLHDFPPYYLQEKIDPLNEEEQKFYPLPFSAKKDSLVRALMNERRFTIDLDELEHVLSLEEFMLYCYKTSFCPLINQKHEWSECNYAHRQQDFRRPPYLFFYMPEKCPSISEDGNWEACEYYLDCQYAHTLVETLFNPLQYKLGDCKDRVPTDKFSCAKLGDLCCHAHSQEEKDLALKALRNVPRKLSPYSLQETENTMRDYLDYLPEYIEQAAEGQSLKRQDSGSSSGDSGNMANMIMSAEKKEQNHSDSISPASREKAAQVVAAKTNAQAAADLNAAQNAQWQKLQNMFSGNMAGAAMASGSGGKTSPIIAPTIIEERKSIIQAQEGISKGFEILQQTQKPMPIPLAPKKPIITPTTSSSAQKPVKPVFVFEPPGSKQPENILEKLSESPALNAIDLTQPSVDLGLNANAQIKISDKKSKTKNKKAKKGVVYTLQPTIESPNQSEEVSHSPNKKQESEKSPEKNTPVVQQQEDLPSEEPMPDLRQTTGKSINENQRKSSPHKEQNKSKQAMPSRSISQQQQQQPQITEPTTNQARQPVHQQAQKPAEKVVEKPTPSQIKPVETQKKTETAPSPASVIRPNSAANQPAKATKQVNRNSSEINNNSRDQSENAINSHKSSEVENSQKSQGSSSALIKNNKQPNSQNNTSANLKPPKKATEVASNPNLKKSDIKNNEKSPAPRISNQKKQTEQHDNSQTTFQVKKRNQSFAQEEEKNQITQEQKASKDELEWADLEEKQLRTLMVYGKRPKTQAEAGVNLVKSHLMESKTAGEALRSINNKMRLASRFAPIGNSESSEGDENEGQGTSEDEAYNRNTVNVESGESIYKLDKNLVGDIDTDFDPSKLMYILQSTEEEVKATAAAKKQQNANRGNTQGTRNRTKQEQNKALAAAGQQPGAKTKNGRQKGEVVQKTFAQKIAGTSNTYAGKTTTSVTPFVPKGLNTRRGEQGRDRTGSSTDANLVNTMDGRMKATGRKGNNQQQQQYSLASSPFKVSNAMQQQDNMIVVNSSNFAFGAQMTQQMNTSPNINDASANEPADQFAFERSTLAGTSHNRLSQGSDAQRMQNSGIAGQFGQYQGSEQPFNCVLFPTLQQVVTVSPEEEEWSEEPVSGQGGFVGSEEVKNQFFGNQGLFSFEGNDEGVNGQSESQIQWSSGAFNVPSSFKELWQDDSPVQENNIFRSSPSVGQTRAVSPTMSQNQGLNNFLSASTQSIDYQQTTSESSTGNGSSAVQAKSGNSVQQNPQSLRQHKIE